MSLQGSFQTIALTDVMALLASSHKSGELRVVGGQLEGRLWLQNGRLVESSVGKSHDHVDAMFELLRLTEGNFVFKEDGIAPAPEAATPVEQVMSDAHDRIREWREIELVIPSIEHRVRLVPDLPTPEVTLSALEWRLVMAVALAATVRGVMDELNLSQFDVGRGIKRLCDAGLVIVEPPRVRPSESDPARLARRAASSANGSHRPVRHGGPENSALEVPVPEVRADSAPPARPTVVPIRASAPVEADQGEDTAPTGVLVHGFWVPNAPPAVAPVPTPRTHAVPADLAAAVAAAAESANSAGDLTSFVEGLGERMIPLTDDDYLADYDEPGDTDVVYFPANGSEFDGGEFDTSPFSVVAPPVVQIDDRYEAPVAPRNRFARKQPASARVAEHRMAHASAADGTTLVDPTSPAEPHDPESGAESLNRGLLLKFLSSVRS